MRTAGGSQRAAWGASVQRWMQDAPTAAAGRAEGPRHPSLRAAPRAHIWRRPRAKAAGRFSLLWRRASRLALIPGEAPRRPAPPGRPATLTWRTGLCRAPAGCGSPPASSAGSARVPGAPYSLRDTGSKAGTLRVRAPSLHVPRHLRGDADHLAPPEAPAPRLGAIQSPLLPCPG